jgi:hypothetical protein
MNFYSIPLTNAAQAFGVLLGGVLYNVTVVYRDVPEGGWVMDIADASQNPILQGVPLVTGIDLLAQYEYLGLGGVLAVVNAAAPNMPPTFDNLGSDALLYWITP